MTIKRYLMEYGYQIGGRAEIVKFLDDHLLKPTTIHEVESYLNLSRSVFDVAPDCCFVALNGKLIEVNKCETCSSQLSLATINACIKAHPDNYFLIMKDACHGLSKPRLIDLKLGTRTHSDHVSEEKKNNHKAKALKTTTSKLGLRLCGATFHNDEDGEIVKWNKVKGKALNAESFVDAMKEFFDVSESQKNAILRQLKKIKTVLEASESLRFFGSSILIAMDDDDESKVNVKLIDFASMARSENNQPQYDGVDKGAILGVNNLIRILNY